MRFREIGKKTKNQKSAGREAGDLAELTQSLRVSLGGAFPCTHVSHLSVPSGGTGYKQQLLFIEC